MCRSEGAVDLHRARVRTAVDAWHGKVGEGVAEWRRLEGVSTGLPSELHPCAQEAHNVLIAPLPYREELDPMLRLRRAFGYLTLFVRHSGGRD